MAPFTLMAFFTGLKTDRVGDFANASMKHYQGIHPQQTRPIRNNSVNDKITSVMCIHTYVITLFMLYLVAKYLNRVLTFAVSWYSAAFLNTKLSSFFFGILPIGT